MAAPPVAERARALEIALEQPERVNEPAVVARIARARPDVLVVCAFGALIKEPLLTAHETLERAPIAAAALAWGRADRACDHGR